MAEEELEDLDCCLESCCCADMETQQPYAKRVRRSRMELLQWQDSHPQPGVSYVFDTTGTMRSLPRTLSPGTNSSSRTDKIKLHGVQIRALIQPNSTAILNNISVFLVYDRRPALDSSGTNITVVTDIVSNITAGMWLPNENGIKRFRILRRWDFLLLGNQVGTVGNVLNRPLTGSEGYMLNEYVSLGLHTSYRDSGSDPISGDLYVVTVGNNAAGTTAAAGNILCRLKWINL